MDDARRMFWARKLRPIHLGGEPVREQLRRRLGVTGVASGLLLAMGSFFGVIFAGFGRWQIGLVIDGVIFVPLLGWLMLDYWRLHCSCSRYSREVLREPFETKTSG